MFLKSLFPGCYLLCNCRKGAFVLLPEVPSLQTPLSWESPSTAPCSTVSSCPFFMLCSPEAFPLEVSAKTLLVSLITKISLPPQCQPTADHIGTGLSYFSFWITWHPLQTSPGFPSLKYLPHNLAYAGDKMLLILLSMMLHCRTATFTCCAFKPLLRGELFGTPAQLLWPLERLIL